MADVFYSKEDQALLAAGKPLPEKGTLTPADYKAMLQMAMDYAVENSPAKDMIAGTSMMDSQGRYYGVTQSEIGPDQKLTGNYKITLDWGNKIEGQVLDPEYGMAYAAQRFSTAFHEVRHVEQRAMIAGNIDPETKLDRELVTQMTVNDLYPSIYYRGYKNTVSEVDADCEGLRGALEFFDAHPEIKERYGFDFRKEIMLTDEYNLLEDQWQVTDAMPEDMLEAMDGYREGVYNDPWQDGRTFEDSAATPGKSEQTLLDRLQETQGLTREDLEGMDNDERNVILIENAIDVIDDENTRIASNLEEYRTGIVMTTRCDEYLREENTFNELVDSMNRGTANLGALVHQSSIVSAYGARFNSYVHVGPPPVAPGLPGPTARNTGKAGILPGRSPAEIAFMDGEENEVGPRRQGIPLTMRQSKQDEAQLGD